MDPKRVAQIIERFSEKRIAVIGDVMVDEWIWGEVNRISPEAPVPVVDVKRRSYTPGGASNVVNNLSSLGARTSLVGVIGKDHPGALLVKELKSRGVQISGLLRIGGRPTTQKTRIIAHNQQVVRADHEQRDPLDGPLTGRMLRALEEAVRGADALVISDYGKGVLTPSLLQAALPAVRKRKALITAGPKPALLPSLKGITLVTLNQREAEQACGFPMNDRETLQRGGKKILRSLACQALLMTRGEHGMLLYQSEGEMRHIPAASSQVYDVSGAGDTVLSVATLALVGGASFYEAALLANYAAGVVVRKVGTATCTLEELEESSVQGRHRS